LQPTTPSIQATVPQLDIPPLNLEVAVIEDGQKTLTEQVHDETAATNPGSSETAMVSETETETTGKNIELDSSKAKPTD
jgi:hypothetical protein